MPAFKHDRKEITLLIVNCVVMLGVVMINIPESCSTPLKGDPLYRASKNVLAVNKNGDVENTVDDEKSNMFLQQSEDDTLPIISRKRRQLDKLSASATTKPYKNDVTIDKLKDEHQLPVSRVTPISPLHLGYYPDDDEEDVFYAEEMDELLQLKKKIEAMKKHQRRRGDIDPNIDYYNYMHHVEDVEPLRGDLVPRNRRSSRQNKNLINKYRAKRSKSNEYDDYWGFGEDEGVTFSDESVENNSTNDLAGFNRGGVEEFKRNYGNRNPFSESTPASQTDLDKKLEEYIAHNRPIIVDNRRIRNRNKSDANNLQVDRTNRLDPDDEKRLNDLSVAAQIIISKNSITGLPSDLFKSRGNFDGEIDFPGINPQHRGPEATRFPSRGTRPTARPRQEPPGACIWAIAHCCTASTNRLTRCFEHLGCPGVNWDSDPCRKAVADAARAEIAKYYVNSG